MRVRLLALMLLAAVAAGCGSSSPSSSPTPTATSASTTSGASTACAARDAIGKQVDALKELTPSLAAVPQVKEALTTIQANLKTIVDQAPNVSDPLRAQIKTANEQFSASVKQIGETVKTTRSASGVKAKLGQALDQLKASYQATLGKLSC